MQSLRDSCSPGACCTGSRHRRSGPRERLGVRKEWGRQMSQGWPRYTPDASEGPGKRWAVLGLGTGVLIFGYLVRDRGGGGDDDD